MKNEDDNEVMLFVEFVGRCIGCSDIFICIETLLLMFICLI